MKLLQKGIIGLAVLAGAALISYLASPVLADSVSPHYQLQETQLGGAGFNGSTSADYQSAGTSAVLGVGTSIGSNYQIQAGHQTTPFPTLSFIVDTGAASFGSFSATQTSTATAAFAVINYTSYGYVVQMEGTPPTYSSHTIPGMATTGAPQTGQDQFGVNLVANTSPISFGANPKQIPDTSFSNGTVNPTDCANITSGYNTANQFKFVSGDTIAAACKTSGETDYTISYVVDVGELTPGGTYVGHQTLICTGTY